MPSRLCEYDRPTAADVTLRKIEPMELVQQATPFDHADWVFEVKHRSPFARVRRERHLQSRQSQRLLPTLCRSTRRAANASSRVLFGDYIEAKGVALNGDLEARSFDHGTRQLRAPSQQTACLFSHPRVDKRFFAI